MSQQLRTVLKSYFETGDFPTEAEFIDLIDSLLCFQNDGVFQWQKITKTFADFQPNAAAFSWIDSFVVPAGFQPVSIVMRPTISWIGGPITGANLQPYYPGDSQALTAAFVDGFPAITDIRGTFGATAGFAVNGLFDVSSNSTSRLLVNLLGGGATINDLTQGSLDIWYQLMKMI